MRRAAEVRKVLIVTLLLNMLVSGSKIAFGFLTYSVAITSDGFHSLFDGVSNIVGLIGVRLASRPPDEQHPYGHRKYETVFTIFIGVLMLVTCYEIFKGVYESLTGRHQAIVSTASFVLMIATTAVNIFVTTYERRKGRALNSEYLTADSRHTKSDIYTSFGVIVSLILIKLGISAADSIAGAVVGLFVAKAGFDIIRESAETLIDRTQVEPSEILRTAECIDGVIECHKIRTRGTRDSVFVDLHCLVHPEMPVGEAHGIAHKVEEEIMRKFPEVVDVVVHVEPADEKKI